MQNHKYCRDHNKQIHWQERTHQCQNQYNNDIVYFRHKSQISVDHQKRHKRQQKFQKRQQIYFIAAVKISYVLSDFK